MEIRKQEPRETLNKVKRETQNFNMKNETKWKMEQKQIRESSVNKPRKKSKQSFLEDHNFVQMSLSPRSYHEHY